jgi:hypothetical protein
MTLIQPIINVDCKNDVMKNTDIICNGTSAREIMMSAVVIHAPNPTGGKPADTVSTPSV